MSEKDKSLQPAVTEEGIGEVNIPEAIEANREAVLGLFDGDDSGGKRAVEFIEHANAEADLAGKLDLLIQAVEEEVPSILLVAPQLIQLLKVAQSEEYQTKLLEFMSQEGVEWELAEYVTDSPPIRERYLETLRALKEAGVVRSGFVDALTRMQALLDRGIDLDVMDDVELLRHEGALEYGAHDPRRYEVLALQFDQSDHKYKAGKYSMLAMEMQQGGAACAIFFDGLNKELDEGASGADIIESALGILKADPHPTDVFDLVERLINQNDTEEALAICREWHRLAPDDLERAMLLLMNLLQMGKDAEAGELAQNLNLVDTDDPQKKALFELVAQTQRLFSEEEFGPQGQALLEEKLANEPDNDELRGVVMEYYWERKDWEGAAEHLEILLENQPYNLEYLDRMSVVAFERKDGKLAEKYIRKALRLEPSAARYGVLAGVKIGSRNPECVELYEKAVEMDPDSLVWLTSLGQAYLLVQRIDDAEEALEKALRMTARSSNDCMSMASLLHALGESDQALNYIDQAIRLDPENERVLEMRQRILNGEEIELN